MKVKSLKRLMSFKVLLGDRLPILHDLLPDQGRHFILLPRDISDVYACP